VFIALRNVLTSSTVDFDTSFSTYCFNLAIVTSVLNTLFEKSASLAYFPYISISMAKFASLISLYLARAYSKVMASI